MYAIFFFSDTLEKEQDMTTEQKDKPSSSLTDPERIQFQSKLISTLPGSVKQSCQAVNWQLFFGDHIEYVLGLLIDLAEHTEDLLNQQGRSNMSILQ